MGTYPFRAFSSIISQTSYHSHRSLKVELPLWQIIMVQMQEAKFKEFWTSFFACVTPGETGPGNDQIGSW
jgi:hypothetical protein